MNWKKCQTLVAAMSAVALMLPGAASAATTKLGPAADSYVDSHYPNSNYGNEERLYAHDGSTSTKRTYLRFDLGGLPAGEIVSNATLFLFTDGGVEGLAIDAHHVTNDVWAENSLTWNNKPSYSPAAFDSQDTVHGWMSWTLPLSTLSADTNGLLSILIKLQQESGNSATATFYSREARYTSEEMARELPYLLVSTTPVPIPATVILLGSGLAGIALLRKKFARS
jgi:hypothetical protein